MKRLGYLKDISSEKVNEKKKLLRDAGCTIIFKDNQVANEQTGFETLLNNLNKGDEVIIENVDHLASSIKTLIERVEQIRKKGAHIELIQTKFNTKKKYSCDEWFEFLKTTAVVMTNSRAKVAREGAKARGRQGGRPEKVSEKDKEEIKRLYHLNLPVKTICDRLNISRPTLYKYLKRF